MKKLFALLFAVTVLAACTKKDTSFEDLETAKNQVRENALFNGQRYRTENPKLDGWSIVSNGDSTQVASCPQGDGWATLTFISPDRKQEVKVKCSTVSGATGCLPDAEFKGKPYAAEDGRCSATSPYPIPKIAK